MTTLDALNALKKFITEKIASEMLLQKEGTHPPEYVHPYVELLTLPHKNFTPARDFQVPLIMISLDSAKDDAFENELQIRITFGVYGGGFYKDDNGAETNIPDGKGYIDLINLIERTKLALAAAGVIEGAGTITRPFSFGTYDTEIVYPYWYGYLSFGMSIPATEFVFREEFSNGL